MAKKIKYLWLIIWQMSNSAVALFIAYLLAYVSVAEFLGPGSEYSESMLIVLTIFYAIWFLSGIQVGRMIAESLIFSGKSGKALSKKKRTTTKKE